MAAPKGNKFWEMRSTHGRNPIFKSPDDLWDACCQYFEYVHENPLMEDKAFAFQGVVTHEPVAKMKAMTMNGLYLFLDIDRATWAEYRGKEGFSTVTTRAEDAIYEQKFTGAAADLLNPNIIARDLGLQDKQQVAHSGNVSTTVLTPERFEQICRDLADDV